MQQSDRITNNKIKQYRCFDKGLYIKFYVVESFE